MTDQSINGLARFSGEQLGFAPGTALPQQPARGKEQIVWALLRGLARRWKRAVIFGVLAATAVGCAIWFLLPPPMPSASAQMYIPTKVPTVLGGEHPDPPLERATQSVLIKSRLVLNAAVRPQEINNLPVLKEQPDPIDWLITKLKVEFNGPEIMRLSLSCEDAEQARILVDAVKDSYLNDIANRSRTDRAEQLRKLAKLELDQKNILLRKRATMNELAKDGTGTDSARRQFVEKMMQSQVQAATTQLISLKADLKAGRLKEEMFAAEAPLKFSDLALNQFVDVDRRVVESAQHLKKMESDLELIRSRAADPKSKVVLNEEEKLKLKKKEHEELRDRVRKEVRTQNENQSKSERASKHLTQRAENQILQQQVKQLENEVEEYSKSLSNTAAVTVELDPFRFEIKQTEDLLIKLEGMIITLKIEEETPPRVLELEKAVITKVDEQKRKVMFAGGGAGLALLLVLSLIALLEYRQKRVDSAGSMMQTFGLRVFGTVPSPFARSTRWWKMESDGYRIQAHSEAISSARAALLHDDALAPHRIFLITSPVSGEGKTTLTMHLASSVAWSGRQTLLVDGDLRKPTLHERFGLPGSPGLCEVLRGEASLFEVIQNTSIPGLMLIPAGNWTPETSEKLVTPHLGQLFSIFRSQFEFVLVDSSPTLPVSDAILMGRHVDGVILSLLQGVSRVPQMIETRNRFQSVGVRVLGAFVSGARRRVRRQQQVLSFELDEPVQLERSSGGRLMRRFWPVIVAGCILIVASLAYGWRTDRWGSAAEVTAAAARLEQNMPTRVGDWDSTPVEVPAEQVRISRAAGISARRYTHRFTGSEVTVLIVCGRPGPIAVHTPDICYQGAGFAIGTSKSEPLLEGNSAWVADFKKEGVQPVTLRIRWAWGTGGAWTASTSPRMNFAREPVLYKMYIVRPVAPGGDPVDRLPEMEFLNEFLPLLPAALVTPR